MLRITAIRSISNRLKNFIMAMAFVATQIIPFAALGGVASAAASADIDQCQNGTISSPAQCTGAAWVNGNANENNSHWREGDSLPYRVKFGGLSLGSHTVTIKWDTTKGGVHALDYITTYNRTETTANPCSGVSGCGSPSTFAIPTDTQVTGAGVTPVGGNFTLYNGTITGVSAYTYPDGTGFAGDKSAQLTITFTASSATPVLAWAGHIASQIDWGLGNSASAVTGSPYHTALVSLDGDSTGSQDRSLKASAVFPTPTMATQVSSSTVTTGQTVTDTATLTGKSNPLTGTVKFYVCGPTVSAAPCTTGGTQVGSSVTLNQDVLATKQNDAQSSAVSSTFTPQAAGVYCFRAEYTPAADAPYSPQNHTNSTTECFTAETPKGSITIVKDAIPNSSQDFSFTTSGLSTDQTGFKLDNDNDPTLSDTKAFNNLPAGDYTVTESATTGWDFDSISCTRGADVDKTGPSVTIHLAAGENVICTYTNRERGTITVHKVTDPADDTTPFTITASTQNGDIDGSAVRNDLATNNSVVYDVSQGDYSVVESAKEGWIEDDSDCATLTVDSDHLNVECTIHNTKKATLVIVKDAIPNDAQDFSFTTTGTGLSAFSLDDDSDATLSNSKSFSVAPGEYSVTEGALSGWKLTGLTCNTNNYTTATNKVTVNLIAGQTTTCTFTNTKLGSIAGVKYEVNADGSTVQTLEGWTIQLKQGDTVLQSTTTDKDGNYLFTDLLPDTYNILEVLQGGWTQIFSPDAVNLTAGQTSTGNNFGNFENGSISGYKFNDLNGDGTEDDGEPKLGSWTINLYDDQDVLLDSKVTDATTGYTFGNLAPGEYKVCEVGKPGWTQTTTPTCYTIEIDESGETNSAVFGNQARGSITVIKNVDNGFGAVTQDASGWTWDYDGTYEDGSNESADSTNTVAVAADSYTINEDQKTDYHFTSVVCTNDGKEFDVDQAESISVRVAAGDDIVCTFTNTRDTGYISVTKYLYPSDDKGLFDLQVNGETEFEDASDEDTTGDIKVVTGDSNNVGELAGTDTDLAHYDSFWVCYSPDKFYIYGQGALSDNFAVSSNGQHVYCAFYNQRLATLTINKDALPNDPQLFDFTIDRKNDCEEVRLSAQTLTRIAEEEGCGIDEVSTFQLQDYQDSTKATHTEELSEGWYRVTEADTEGWVLTDVDCGEADVKIDGGSVYVYLEYGDQVTCTYTNTKLATVTVVKDAQPDSSQAFNFTTSLGDSFTLTDNGVVSTNSKTFTDVMPGTYTISEESVAGWNLHSINCGEGTQISYAKGELSLIVEPGANVTCTFVNTKIPGKVLGTTTELVNTGDNGLVNILAGTILISFAMAARWFGRKQNATSI